MSGCEFASSGVQSNRMSPDSRIESNDNVVIIDLRPDLLRVPPLNLKPPTVSRIDSLPLRNRDWKVFERLIVATVRDVLGWRDVREYGVPGEEQHGIDILGYSPSSGEQSLGESQVLTCQCKDVESFTAGNLRAVVDKFNDGYRPLSSRYLSIAVSCITESVPLVEELYRLRILHPNLTIHLWGARQINEMLEDQNLIVRRFFGPSWEEAFCTPVVRADIRSDSVLNRRRLIDFIARAEEASYDRLLSRWLAAGVEGELALELAAEKSVGNFMDVSSKVASPGLYLIEGDFGSGKSVTVERVYQEDLKEFRDGGMLFLPIRVEARQVVNTVENLCEVFLDDLALDSNFPVRLIIDGLDEVGPARAHLILRSAESYVLRRSYCRVIATIRPGVSDTVGAKKILQPLLSADESEALIERVSGVRYARFHQSPAVADAVRRPLFALIAATLSGSGQHLPQSAGGFLDELVGRALRMSDRPQLETQNLLERLAEGVVRLGGSAVPISEIGGNSVVEVILATRLVVKSGRAIKFSLPILEQYFAGLALLRDGAVDRILDDLSVIDRWRYGLVLATTIGSWEQVNRLLAKISSRHPGIAAWVVSEAVPSSSYSTEVGLPPSLECAERVHYSFNCLAKGVPALSEKLHFIEMSGDSAVVGARVEDRHLTVGLKRLNRTGETGFQVLPWEVGLFSRHYRDHDWDLITAGSSFPVDYSAWPWHISLQWMRSGFESLFKNYGVSWRGNSAASAEFHWLLARTLVRESGNSRHKPIHVDRILEVANGFLEDMKEEGFRAIKIDRAAFNIYPDMLREFTEKIERDSSESAWVERPYVVPDALDSGGRWVWNLYTPESMLKLCNQVVMNALLIYQDVCERFLSNLIPTLGLGSLFPVSIQGVLEFSGDPGYEGSPSLGYYALPVQSGQESSVDIKFGPMPAWGDHSALDAIDNSIARNRPAAIGWATTSYSSWSVSVYKERPATRLALKWLNTDLRRLRLMDSRIRSDED